VCLSVQTTEECLNALTLGLVGVPLFEFLAVSINRLPAASKCYSKLFGQANNEAKVGAGLVAAFKSAPKQARRHTVIIL
jgi:hypothetical protein